jgi:chemotaxis protein MotB
LLSQLDAKGGLAIEQERLNKSAQRLQELESLIAAKEATMKKLKETLSNALNSFEGKGLTVEQKNGRYTYPWKTNYCLIPVVGP